MQQELLQEEPLPQQLTPNAAGLRPARTQPLYGRWRWCTAPLITQLLQLQDLGQQRVGAQRHWCCAAVDHPRTHAQHLPAELLAKPGFKNRQLLELSPRPERPGGELRHRDAHHHGEREVEDQARVEGFAVADYVHCPAAQVAHAHAFRHAEPPDQASGDEQGNRGHQPTAGKLMQHNRGENPNEGSAHHLAQTPHGCELVVVDEHHRDQQAEHHHVAAARPLHDPDGERGRQPGAQAVAQARAESRQSIGHGAGLL